jgi:hypothetical protein
MKRRWSVVGWGVAGFLGLGTLAGFSQQVDLQLHGYGSWNYGYTDNNNHFVAAGEDGEYDHTQFALNLNAAFNENLRAQVQPCWVQGDEETETDLDYAFGEFKPWDQLALKAGRVVHPFGWYGDIYDVGTLRPFLVLPQSIYGQFGLWSSSYQGAGARGVFEVTQNSSLSYDLYGGQMEYQDMINWGGLFSAGMMSQMQAANPRPMVSMLTQAMIGEPEPVDATLQDAVGGRLIYDTPLAGLSFGVSAYMGDVQQDDSSIEPSRQDVYLGQAQYGTDKFRIRTEAAHMEVEDSIAIDAAYGEASCRLPGFLKAVELALRYDWLDAEMEDMESMPVVPAGFDNLMKHEEWAFGVNYWFNPNLVTKLSYHMVEGNAYAHPEDLTEFGEGVMAGTLEEDTDVIMAGVQFSF